MQFAKDQEKKRGGLLIARITSNSRDMVVAKNEVLGFHHVV